MILLKHPGNILLLNDGTDRLALVDFGQVSRLDQELRKQYARLIVALADDNREGVVAALTEMGGRTERMDPDVLYKLGAFWNDRQSDDVTGGRNLSDFLDHLESLDPTVAVTERHLQASRANILLRGIGSAFGIEYRTSLLWRPFAIECLNEPTVEEV